MAMTKKDQARLQKAIRKARNSMKNLFESAIKGKNKNNV